MSALDDLLKKHRKRIIDREEAAFREMLVVYEDLQRDLSRQYTEIQKLITDAAAAGEEIKGSWILKSRRLNELLAQAQEQVVRFGGRVSAIVSREQAEAMTIAGDHTRDVVELITSNPMLGSMLPSRAVENAVGMMGDGSPMTAYFEKTLAPAVAEKLKQEIITAAATGTDFRTIARRLEAAGDITRSRALAIARTEVNRVRRATTQQIYQENLDVIEGWEWVASKSSRTCPACLALDGSIHKLDESFPQHINCRCTMIPVIIGVARPKRTLGSEWFDEQPDEIKEKIIGVDALKAYKEGIIKLKDLVGYATSKEFGRRIYTKPLINVLAAKPVAEMVIRTPRNIEVLFEGGAGEILEKVLGRKLTPNEVGGLVGGFDGAKVRAFNTPIGLAFEIDHPLIQVQRRILSIDEDGELFMHNVLFRTTRTAPKGMGTKAFATQVHHAEKFGISYIDTEAAGDFKSSHDKKGWNGYYTWARLGYNAPLDEADWEKFPLTYRGLPDLHSLFQQENGPLVWKYHGSGRPMVFDLDRESTSWRLLQKYLHQKGFGVEFSR
jgi:SPP1 gp7 family putative phage head morphogenesis protein